VLKLLSFFYIYQVIVHDRPYRHAITLKSEGQGLRLPLAMEALCLRVASTRLPGHHRRVRFDS